MDSDRLHLLVKNIINLSIECSLLRKSHFYVHYSEYHLMFQSIVSELLNFHLLLDHSVFLIMMENFKRSLKFLYFSCETFQCLDKSCFQTSRGFILSSTFEVNVFTKLRTKFSQLQSPHIRLLKKNCFNINHQYTRCFATIPTNVEG